VVLWLVQQVGIDRGGVNRGEDALGLSAMVQHPDNIMAVLMDAGCRSSRRRQCSGQRRY